MVRSLPSPESLRLQATPQGTIGFLSRPRIRSLIPKFSNPRLETRRRFLSISKTVDACVEDDECERENLGRDGDRAKLGTRALIGLTSVWELDRDEWTERGDGYL